MDGLDQKFVSTSFSVIIMESLKCSCDKFQIHNEAIGY